MEGEEVWLILFLTSSPDQLYIWTFTFTSVTEPRSLFNKRLAAPQNSSGPSGEEKISCSYRDSKTGSASPFSSHYTENAIPARRSTRRFALKLKELNTNKRQIAISFPSTPNNNMNRITTQWTQWIENITL